ncbi:MAG: hypothetical protein KC561_05655 [Myxococcales bacterium]|nr:hypothetical protein [Myxococcales bacterium]
MDTFHESKNLKIEYDPDTRTYELTVSLGGEEIKGTAPGACPCGKAGSRPTLWELEGPGAESNVMWLVCGKTPQCELDGRPLRWAVDVTFERDWSEE